MRVEERRAVRGCLAERRAPRVAGRARLELPRVLERRLALRDARALGELPARAARAREAQRRVRRRPRARPATCCEPGPWHASQPTRSSAARVS